MTIFPFLLVLENALAASGTGTAAYTVPTGETLSIHELLQMSTGTFNVTDIRDSKGIHYTNASAAVEIPQNFFADVADQFNNIGKFEVPIVVEGGVTLMIDLEDSSGAANTVTLLLHGVKETG